MSGWALVSPAAILIGIFGLLPVLMSLKLSFQKSDLLSAETPWVGFDNYKKLADDPVFLDAIKHTIIYTALFVPGTMLVGLFRRDGAESIGAVHLGVPNRRVRDDGGVDDLAGHHLPLADRPRLRSGQRHPERGGHLVAAFPGLAVPGVVRHRRHDGVGAGPVSR